MTPESQLTPVYNGERYLPECIESVLAQTYLKMLRLGHNPPSEDRGGSS